MRTDFNLKFVFAAHAFADPFTYTSAYPCIYPCTYTSAYPGWDLNIYR
jgi:hypothetical protein